MPGKPVGMPTAQLVPLAGRGKEDVGATVVGVVDALHAGVGDEDSRHLVVGGIPKQAGCENVPRHPDTGRAACTRPEGNRANAAATAPSDLSARLLTPAALDRAPGSGGGVGVGRERLATAPDRVAPSTATQMPSRQLCPPPRPMHPSGDRGRSLRTTPPIYFSAPSER